MRYCLKLRRRKICKKSRSHPLVPITENPFSSSLWANENCHCGNSPWPALVTFEQDLPLSSSWITLFFKKILSIENAVVCNIVLPANVWWERVLIVVGLDSMNEAVRNDKPHFTCKSTEVSCVSVTKNTNVLWYCLVWKGMSKLTL